MSLPKPTVTIVPHTTFAEVIFHCEGAAELHFGGPDYLEVAGSTFTEYVFPTEFTAGTSMNFTTLQGINGSEVSEKITLTQTAIMERATYAKVSDSMEPGEEICLTFADYGFDKANRVDIVVAYNGYVQSFTYYSGDTLSEGDIRLDGVHFSLKANDKCLKFIFNFNAANTSLPVNFSRYSYMSNQKAAFVVHVI